MLSPASWGDWDLFAPKPLELKRPKWEEPRSKPLRDFEEVLQAHGSVLRELAVYRPNLTQTEWDWAEVPYGVDPLHGGLPVKRAERKRRQIENLSNAASALVQPGDVIVDFCSGAGAVGLALAHRHRDCTVFLLDFNPVSLEIARKRVKTAGLTNVVVRSGRVEGKSAPTAAMVVFCRT